MDVHSVMKPKAQLIIENLNFQLILAIPVFISSLDFMLSRDDYEEGFITSGPDQKFHEGHNFSLNIIDNRWLHYPIHKLKN